MDMRLTSLPIDLSVREAISALRRARRDTLYYLYVTDRVGKLIGVLDMRELLLASPRDPLESLVKREIVTVPVDMPSDEVASLIQRRRFVALPVVDRDGHLLGVVKPDEVLEAFQQEAFGDLQKMVGAGEDERALSPVSVVVRKRLPWLYVNLGTAFLRLDGGRAVREHDRAGHRARGADAGRGRPGRQHRRPVARGGDARDRAARAAARQHLAPACARRCSAR